MAAKRRSSKRTSRRRVTKRRTAKRRVTKKRTKTAKRRATKKRTKTTKKRTKTTKRRTTTKKRRTATKKRRTATKKRTNKKKQAAVEEQVAEQAGEETEEEAEQPVAEIEAEKPVTEADSVLPLDADISEEIDEALRGASLEQEEPARADELLSGELGSTEETTETSEEQSTETPLAEVNGLPPIAEGEATVTTAGNIHQQYVAPVLPKKRKGGRPKGSKDKKKRKAGSGRPKGSKDNKKRKAQDTTQRKKRTKKFKTGELSFDSTYETTSLEVSTNEEQKVESMPEMNVGSIEVLKAFVATSDAELLGGTA